MAKRRVRHYSGPGSAWFWRRVERLGYPTETTAFALGCALQDLEDRAMLALEFAEEQATRRAKRRST